MTRLYSSISVETILSSAITSSQTSMAVATGTGSALLGGVVLAAGNVDQFTIAIDPDTVNEEIVFVTGNSGDTFTIVRGRSGSTAITHASGATVRHVMTSNDLDYFNTAIQPATLTAKGDTYVATASGVVTNLAAGSNGQVLTADSTVAKGLKWATPTAGSVTSVTAGTGLSGGTITTTGTIAIDSTVATLTGTQTLTNKTLTSPVLTTPSISNIDAKGDLLAGTADNTIGRLAVGANGTVLTADSAAATGLKWAAAAGGGGLTFIKSQTIGSAVTAVTVTDAFSATYDNYLIIVSGGSGNVAGGNCNLTLGSTTSGYYQAGYYMFYSSTSLAGNIINNGAKWEGTYFSSNAHSGHITLQNPYLSKTTIFHSALTAADTTAYTANASGWLNNTTSYTAFTLTANSGNITGGEIRVYGYQNS